MDKFSEIILPPEIILKIFDQLNLNELLTVSLVCRLWYTISHHPLMVKKYMIYVNSENQMKSLIKSQRFFSNLIFAFHPTSMQQLRFYHKFWKINLNNLQYVCLEGIQDTNLALTFLLKSKTLKTLEFRKINYLFSLGNLRVDQQTCNIRNLSFGNYLCDDLKIPMQILSLIPKLESLQIKTCKMDSNFLIYLQNPKFTSYLTNLNLFLDVNTFTSKYVRRHFLHFLKFKHFNFEQFCFNFKTTVFNQTDHKKILKFFLRQKKLKSLKILTCGEIVIFDELISGLPNLKSIGVETQSEIDPYLMNSKEFILEKFEKFWSLETLEIHLSQYFQFNYPIFDSLTGKCNLRKLHILRSNLRKNAKIIEKMQFLTQLTVLTITESIITDPLLQGIFEHLLELRELCLISREDNVTNSGITGNYSGANGFSVSRLTHLQRICISLNESEISDLALREFSKLKFLQILWLQLDVEFSESEKNNFKMVSNAKLYYPGGDQYTETPPNWVYNFTY